MRPASVLRPLVALGGIPFALSFHYVHNLFEFARDDAPTLTAEQGERRTLTAPTVATPSRLRASLLLLIALIALIGLIRPGEATAFVSGQQEAWTVQWGSAEGQLYDPLQLGVDSTDGSVYVTDAAPDLSSLRVQKFSPTGQFLGATAPIPLGTTGLVGIAVDHDAGRFYLLQTEAGIDTEHEAKYVAKSVLVFSTTPNASKVLVPAAPTAQLPAPAPNTADTLFEPHELVLDPSNGDLVVVAEDRLERVVLQRIGSDGVAGGRYAETGSTLSLAKPFGVALDGKGVTYVVASSGAGQQAIRAYTLPADFASPLTLTAVPGFVAAGVSEQWPTGAETGLLTEPFFVPVGLGPQVAVSSAADGSAEVLYYKTDGLFVDLEHPGDFYIRGFSLPDEATATVWGGGATEGQCAIQSRRAALAVSAGGDLVVLDHGELILSEGELPDFGPNVFRFGPEAEDSSCPIPAAGFKLKQGASEVASVPVGATVTLDGSESELNGQTLTEMVWTIEGPGGSVTTVPVTAPGMTLDRQFSAAGTYTIRLEMKTSTNPVGPSAKPVGNTFSARARTLEVTGGGEPVPTITNLNPTHGPQAGGTSVTITGTGFTGVTGATGVKFGANNATNYTVNSDTQITATAPAGTGTVNVVVTNPTGPSADVAADNYTYDVPPATIQLTVQKTGTGQGTVTSNPGGIDCGAACVVTFNHGQPVTLTATPAVGSTFAGWGGVCSGSGATCVPPTTSSVTVTAQFNAIVVSPPPPPPPPEEPLTCKKGFQKKTVGGVEKCVKKPIKCKKGFKKVKAKGKVKCVKVKGKGKKRTSRASRSESNLFAPAGLW